MRYRPQKVPPAIRIMDVIADRQYGPAADVGLAGVQDYLAFEFQGSSFHTRPGQMAYVYRL